MRSRTRLIGASAVWFVMDFASFGDTVSSHWCCMPSRLTTTLTQPTVFATAAVPGYPVAAVVMGRLGRMQ